MPRKGKPEAGDYLENGTRMVRVAGYTQQGDLLIEDSVTEAVEVLALSQMSNWRKVTRRNVGV